MQLRYYDPLQRDEVVPSYTGNITEWRWQHTDPLQPNPTPQANSYGFAYDGLGRLRSNDHLSAASLSAAGADWATAGNGFREYGLTYDLNGNILSLGRSGFAANAAAPVPVTDALSYTYSGNQLASLDHSNVSGSVAAAGKKKYSYDSNGNMFYDERKGLHFGYNYLNLLSAVSEAIVIGAQIDSLSMYSQLPYRDEGGGTGADPDPEDWVEGCGGDPLPGGGGVVVVGPKDPVGIPRISAGSRVATYTWLADGTKLQVADSIGRGYVYLGSLVYSKDGNDLTLESTGFGGGRITASEGPDGAGYMANYQLTDHLGSVRVVFESRKNVLARNDYYAFGKKHLNADLQTATGDINRWHFNGKEWQTTAAVGFLDYGARMYDQEIGRWFNPDLLSEKYYPHSPYVFTGNNPVGYIDLHGLDWYSYMDYRYDDDGNIIGGTRQYEYRRGPADDELMSRSGFMRLGLTHYDELNETYYSLSGFTINSSLGDAMMAVMNADQVAMYTIAGFAEIEKFWDKLGNAVNLGLDYAALISSYVNNHGGGVKSVSKSIKPLGIGLTILDGISLYNAFQNGADVSGWDIADVAVGITGLMGWPGAAIAGGYHMAKAGTTGLVLMEQAMKHTFMNWFNEMLSQAYGIPVDLQRTLMGR